MATAKSLTPSHKLVEMQDLQPLGQDPERAVIYNVDVSVSD